MCYIELLVSSSPSSIVNTTRPKTNFNRCALIFFASALQTSNTKIKAINYCQGNIYSQWRFKRAYSSKLQKWNNRKVYIMPGWAPATTVFKISNQVLLLLWLKTNAEGPILQYLAQSWLLSSGNPKTEHQLDPHTEIASHPKANQSHPKGSPALKQTSS